MNQVGEDKLFRLGAAVGLKIDDVDFLLQEDSGYILLEQGGSAKIGDLPVDASPALAHQTLLVHDPSGSAETERLSIESFFNSAQSLSNAVSPNINWQIPVVTDTDTTPTLRRVTLDVVYNFLETIGGLLPDGLWAQALPVGGNIAGRSDFGDFRSVVGPFVLPTGTSEGFERMVGNLPSNNLLLGEYFLLSQTPSLDSWLAWFKGSQRIFVGFVSTAAVFTSDTPVGDFMGFVASAPRGDTTIYCLCRTGGAETRINTGLTYTSSVFRRYQIDYDPATTTATFRVNGATVATISTNIPSHTTGMYLRVGCQNLGTDILDWSRVTFSTL